MAELADFISRIFSSGRTQGLSGGAEVVVDEDPASAFYASRLRKHRTDEDLIERPENLWSTLSFNGRKGGLRAHIIAEKSDGIASFTDVLLVVNQADARRAATIAGEPWTENAARVVSEQFTAFCAKEKFELLYGTRPLRFFIVADGGRDMTHHSFGLDPGEFITGLIPNLYIGPAPRSRAVLAVHLNLPGVWEGYREVGRLYSDQIVFTLGRHWLDNYHHPSLREPGLYRLQQYPDGSLTHIISPELQDRYMVRSDQTDAGPAVLTVAEWDGRPVAYLVLAVIDSMTMEFNPSEQVPLSASSSDFAPEAAGAAERGPLAASFADIPMIPTIPNAPAPVAAESGEDATNVMGRVPTASHALSDGGTKSKLDSRQKTIVPDTFETRMLTMQERGALLQKVHFANFMEGYDVYIGPKGQIATMMPGPKATLQVRAGRVALVVHSGGVSVDGKAFDVGRTIPLTGTVQIEVDGATIQYRDLTGIRVDGWPYLGELRRNGSGSYLDFGAAYRIGRDRRCKVRLPDEPHNDNIAWLASVGGGATIRSRTGDIPKSRFYTDSIMVASEHAEVELAGAPKLRSLARHCYTYVRRGDEVIALFPREGAGGRHEADLQPGDEILVGNCLFHVSYPPPERSPGASMPPVDPPKLSAAALAAAADLVAPAAPAPAPASFGMAASSPAPAKPVPAVQPAAAPQALTPAAADALAAKAVKTVPKASITQDIPAAAGLGERGPAPRPVKIDAPKFDSVLGVEAPSPRAKPKAATPTPKASPLPSPASVEQISVPPTLPKPVEAPPARLSASKGGEAAKPPAEKPPPPMILEESDFGDPTVAVEESQWQLELARPAKLTLEGWTVRDETVIGNHRGVGMIVPEVRAFAEQAFMTLDYFRVQARGKKGRIDLIQDGEAKLTVNGGQVRSTEDLDHAELRIVRRDENLEPDFDVTLRFTADVNLPDPRARMLAVDTSDRLVYALFTLGFPLRSPRTVRLGPITATFQYDAQGLKISDYLTSYRTGAAGFVPFFMQEGGRNWRTLPEDGSTVNLLPGDAIMAGNAVYRLRVG